jgi:hypothetical protein
MLKKRGEFYACINTADDLKYIIGLLSCGNNQNINNKIIGIPQGTLCEFITYVPVT